MYIYHFIANKLISCITNLESNLTKLPTLPAWPPIPFVVTLDKEQGKHWFNLLTNFG